MKVASTSMEIWLSQLCKDDAIITEIASQDEKIRKNLGFRGPQNDHIPLSSYNIRDWARLIIKRRRPRPFKNHDSINRILNYYNNYSNYFSFCFERNPWDKVVSLYYYSLHQRNAGPEELSISEFIEQAPHRISNWDQYTNQNDDIIVNHVAEFENLDEELEKICSEIGVSEERMGPLPRAKTNHREKKSYQELLTDHDAEKIRKLCQKEVEYFGYTFDGESEQKVSIRSDKQFSSRANKHKKKDKLNA